ncbi:14155_t:CDS:2 [Acaulospora colombiana]|uniref:14155_t:CDS:1 n=1 Tax=Acaulospora colombiana TaxID=27376 RepID=A0ACA9KGA1_9GLOM|nr:14155_t:CDS:2 [Acaulospora colombiana]
MLGLECCGHEIDEFFAELDKEFEARQNQRNLERSFDKNSSELLQKSGDLNTAKLKSHYIGMIANFKPDDYSIETDSEYVSSDDLDFSDSDREEKEIDKRKHGYDYDGDYEPSNSSTVSSDSDNQQKKDEEDSSMLLNQEQLPTVIVTNPITQTPGTPLPRHNVNHIQATPQKSVLFKESVTYLQNHIKINVNNQGIIIKDNHTSAEISSVIRNWLVTVLSVNYH